VVSTSTWQLGCWTFSLRVATTPLITGMLRSISTTWG
jgi:hypothetical protein